MDDEARDAALTREISLPLFQARAWMKLVGIVSIVIGILIALSIVGILIAWLPIWMGVILYRAGSSIEAALHTGDRQALLHGLRQLRLFFTVMGVLVLLWLLLLLSGLFFGATSFHMMMWRMPHVFI